MFLLQATREFRRTVDVKQLIHLGTNERKIYLPGEEFVYGRKNR